MGRARAARLRRDSQDGRLSGGVESDHQDACEGEKGEQGQPRSVAMGQAGEEARRLGSRAGGEARTRGSKGGKASDAQPLRAEPARLPRRTTAAAPREPSRLDASARASPVDPVPRAKARAGVEKGGEARKGREEGGSSEPSGSNSSLAQPAVFRHAPRFGRPSRLIQRTLGGQTSRGGRPGAPATVARSGAVGAGQGARRRVFRTEERAGGQGGGAPLSRAGEARQDERGPAGRPEADGKGGGTHASPSCRRGPRGAWR